MSPGRTQLEYWCRRRGSNPPRFALHRAAANPLRQSTAFAYDVPSPGGTAELGLYDGGGRLVRSLVEGPQTPGARSIAGDGRDDVGRALPAGGGAPLGAPRAGGGGRKPLGSGREGAKLAGARREFLSAGRPGPDHSYDDPA